MKHMLNGLPFEFSPDDLIDITLTLALAGSYDALVVALQVADNLQWGFDVDNSDIINYAVVSRCVHTLKMIIDYAVSHNQKVDIFYSNLYIIGLETGDYPLDKYECGKETSDFYMEACEKEGRLKEFIDACLKDFEAVPIKCDAALAYRLGDCARYYDLLETARLLRMYKHSSNFMVMNTIRDVLLARDAANLQAEMAARFLGLRLNLPGEVTRCIAGFNKCDAPVELRAFGNHERALPVTTVPNRPVRAASVADFSPPVSKRVKANE
jgi:hypothetical protein